MLRIQAYVKAALETTYPDLERLFCDKDIRFWLIAIPKNLTVTVTNMNLQGSLDKKYAVAYRFQWNPPRPRDREL